MRRLKRLSILEMLALLKGNSRSLHTDYLTHLQVTENDKSLKTVFK